MELALAVLYPFGLVLFRTSALIAVAPLFSARVIPVRVKLGLALCISLCAYSGAGAPRLAPPSTFAELAAAVAAETLLGLFGGLGPRMLLEAATGAGQAAGLTMGLGVGALLDPNSGAESTSLGQLFGTLAIASAVSLGLHREAILWLAYGVRATPPGSVLVLRDLLLGAIEQGIASIALSVRVAFPLFAAATFGHAALGVIGRSAPQLNLSSVGFSVAILAGGGMLYLVVPDAAAICAQAATNAFGSR